MNHIVTGGFTSIQQATSSIKKGNAAGKNKNISNASFQEIFQQKKSITEAVGEREEQALVKFSKHADTRLRQRDIQLTDEQISRLNEGAQKASLKGIKESLVLLDDLAFIVNTENKIVVTAMSQAANDENIYTNIDGAVII